MNWGEILSEKSIDLLFAIVQSFIIAFISGHILNRAFAKQKNIGKTLSSYGFERVSLGSGTLTTLDRNKLFGLHLCHSPSELSLCFLTGVHFFNDYSNYIERLVNKGATVRVLLQNPTKSPLFKFYDFKLGSYSDLNAVAEYYYQLHANNTEHIDDASFSDSSFIMLTSEKFRKYLSNKKYCIEEIKKHIALEGDHITQAIEVTQKLEKINATATNGGRIEIRYYNSEYRIPMIFAKYTKKKKTYTLLWTNLNAPIREAMESVNVHCKQNGSESAFYVQDIEASFNYLFDKYKHTSSCDGYLRKELDKAN